MTGNERRLLHFGYDDGAQFGVRFDDEPARGRLERKPSAETGLEQSVGGAKFAGFRCKVADHLIDRHLGA